MLGIGPRSAFCCCLLCSKEPWVPIRKSRLGSPTADPPSGPVRAVDATETEDAVGLVCVGDIELVAGVLSTKNELVLAHQQGYVILQGKGVVVELGDGVRSAADGEFAGGRQSAGRWADPARDQPREYWR